MAAVAVAYVAYKGTDSIVLTALVFSGNTLPFLVLAPASGRLTTRFELRKLLIVLDAGKACVWVAITALAGLAELSYVHLLLANFAYGSLAALGVTAWPRITESIAPPGRLPEVSGLLATIPAVSAIAGALLGGALIVAVGEVWVFAFNALTYPPVIVALLLLPSIAPLPRKAGGTMRNGASFVMRTDRLMQAFVLAALLNFAAFPLLSMLPAMAHDIDARGHVLGLLTCAFYAGGALVVWAVAMLRRRYAYSRILFVGFLAAGLLLIAHGAITAWRSPGLDAVTVSLLTLLPLGLAVSLNAALLQALILLSCPDEEKAGVLAGYGMITAVLTPLGGILLGLFADLISPWVACFLSGVVLAALALTLRTRLGVFDALGEGVREGQLRHSIGPHWHAHTRFLAGADFAFLSHLHPHIPHDAEETKGLKADLPEILVNAPPLSPSGSRVARC